MLKFAIDTYLSTFHLALNFSAEEGTTTVLLGESGAGKSTVLRALAGLLSPQRGHISLAGATYFDSEQAIAVPPQERPFAFVFQDYVLFPHLTVFENVAFGLRAQRLARALVRERVIEALEQVRLSGLEMRRPHQLSGGQQQRVAIARALVLQPSLLLLDEPLAALDVQTRREVRQELRLLLKETRITTVMVTHQYFEALLFGQQILVLDQGQIIQQGNQRDLREYPRSSYVAELVGVNFFHGRIRSFEAGSTCVIVLDNGIEIVATLKEPDGAEEAFVVIEPRHITLHTEPPTGSARNMLHGQIIHILSSGSPTDSIRVSLDLDGDEQPLTAEITATSLARLNLYEGQPIYATFKASEANAYT